MSSWRIHGKVLSALSSNVSSSTLWKKSAELKYFQFFYVQQSLVRFFGGFACSSRRTKHGSRFSSQALPEVLKQIWNRNTVCAVSLTFPWGSPSSHSKLFLLSILSFLLSSSIPPSHQHWKAEVGPSRSCLHVCLSLTRLTSLFSCCLTSSRQFSAVLFHLSAEDEKLNRKWKHENLLSFFIPGVGRRAVI